jgi:hypothetical protein
MNVTNSNIIKELFERTSLYNDLSKSPNALHWVDAMLRYICEALDENETSETVHHVLQSFANELMQHIDKADNTPLANYLQNAIIIATDNKPSIKYLVQWLNENHQRYRYIDAILVDDDSYHNSLLSLLSAAHAVWASDILSYAKSFIVSRNNYVK